MDPAANPPAKMSDIDKLNDDCLIAVFKNFSHRELIALRAVCTRWNALILVVGKSKHTLKLFGSFRDVDDYCRALITYQLETDAYFKLSTKSTSDEVVGIGYNTKVNANSNKRSTMSHPGASFNFLATLFPNITELIICDRYSDLSTFGPYSTSWQTLVKIDYDFLLGKWTKLSSLSLFMFPQKRILDALSYTPLPNLKRFEFFKTSRYYAPGANDNTGIVSNLNALPSNVWSQLEYFSLGCNASDISYIFARLEAKNLKHLNLYCCTYQELQELCKRKPELVSNLTHFTCNISNHTVVSIDIVCDNFTSLQSLCLIPYSVNQASFEKIIEQVSKLRRLTELRVCYSSQYDSNINESRSTQVVSEEAIKKYQFSSIKTLQLKNSALLRNQSPELSAWIPKLFPNLEHLIIGDHCTKTTFRAMQRINNSFLRFLKQQQNDKPLSDLHHIPLKDDLTPFIGTYQRLYQNFKLTRKNTQYNRRPRRNYQIIDFFPLQIFDDLDQEFRALREAVDNWEEPDPDDDQEDNPVDPYPEDENGVILID